VKDIILDVDTGIDDALALMVAATIDDFNVLGVTTVAGNIDLATATENTQAILGLIGLKDVPVAAGAAGPLVRPLKIATTFHGERGLGEFDVSNWDFPRATLAPMAGPEFIARAARERPGAITLIATGPLTNVALALKSDTALAGRLAEIVIMGGAIETAGNVSPVAEANFHNDPEAASIVLQSGVPIVLVPLDVTEQVIVTRSRLDQLGQSEPSPVLDVAESILAFYLGASERFGHEGCAMHDPLAVLLAARPELAKLTPMHVHISTHDPLTAGHCVVDRRRPTPHRPVVAPNVRSATRVQIDACRELILAALTPD
jgi:inosine-uridine nucleoside N-ribohydrolase